MFILFHHNTEGISYQGQHFDLLQIVEHDPCGKLFELLVIKVFDEKQQMAQELLSNRLHFLPVCKYFTEPGRHIYRSQPFLKCLTGQKIILDENSEIFSKLVFVLLNDCRVRYRQAQRVIEERPRQTSPQVTPIIEASENALRKPR